MFVTIDGPDGTGKTTVARALAQRLEARGIPCALTAEPTDSPLGREIRALLRNGGASPARLTELFVQDRAAHVETFIKPQLAENRTVICDRYKYSTVCYQHLQGEPLERLIQLNNPFPAPDFAVILTVERASVLLERIGARGLERDVFETKQVLEQAIALYKDMGRYYPKESFLYLDAGQPLEITVSAIVNHLSAYGVIV